MAKSQETVYLQNHFIFAMPTLVDANFRHSVLYLCEHNENGAVGIMVNRPTTITLAEILADMRISVKEDTEDTLRHIPVLFGGPVHQERGFVIHRTQGNWRSTLKASDDFFITTSKDILEALAVHEGPKDVIVALGCAAWEPGQLEQEMIENAWLHAPASSPIVFETPFELRYAEAMGILGINLANLSEDVGHG